LRREIDIFRLPFGIEIIIISVDKKTKGVISSFACVYGNRANQKDPPLPICKKITFTQTLYFKDL